MGEIVWNAVRADRSLTTICIEVLLLLLICR